MMCDTDEIWYMRAVSVVYLVVVVVAVNVFVVYHLVVCMRGNRLHDPVTLRRFGFMYAPFRTHALYWGVVRLSKQAALVAVQVLLWQTPAAQALAGVAVLVLRVAVLRPNGRLLFPLVSGVLRGHVHIFRLGLRVVRCWGDEIILVTRAVLALGVALTLTRGAVLGMHLHVRAERPGVIRVLDLLVALRRRRFRAVARALLGAGSTDSPESARTLLRRGIRLRGALLRGLRFDCHERCARGRALPVTHRRGGWYRVAHRAR